AEAAENHLKQAESKASRPDAEFRRWAVDIRAQAALGRFFAEKFRAAVEFAFFEGSRDRRALDRAVQHYRAARAAWQHLSVFTQDAYTKDLAFGRERRLRGHWSDRLAAIDEDLADMEKLLRESVNPAESGTAEGSISRATDPQAGDSVGAYGRAPLRSNVRNLQKVRHTPAQSFQRGAALSIELNAGELDLIGVRLNYRHANQAEAYRVADMTRKGATYHHAIPAEYTDSPYPLIYFFQLRDRNGHAWLHPGFNSTLSNQPYYAIRSVK
ncbi:MAG TPA: hypothetical protein VGL91_08515, partial [Acidobacteriota bacterium]